MNDLQVSLQISRSLLATPFFRTCPMKPENDLEHIRCASELGPHQRGAIRLNAGLRHSPQTTLHQ
jgi:hypothetical protein